MDAIISFIFNAGLVVLLLLCVRGIRRLSDKLTSERDVALLSEADIERMVRPSAPLESQDVSHNTFIDRLGAGRNQVRLVFPAQLVRPSAE